MNTIPLTNWERKGHAVEKQVYRGDGKWEFVKMPWSQYLMEFRDSLLKKNRYAKIDRSEDFPEETKKRGYLRLTVDDLSEHYE